MQISRRKLLGGSAALAVAAVLPKMAPTEAIVGWDLGVDERVVVWVANPSRPAPFMVFANGEISPLLEDLRPGAITWFPAEPVLNRPWRTAADDLVDFGNSFETADGKRIPPEDWPEEFYKRDKLEAYWENVKDWKPT